MTSLNNFFLSLISPELHGQLFWLKVVFCLIALYFLFGIFYFGWRGKYFQDRRRHMIFWRDYKEEFAASHRHEKKWIEIEQLLRSELSADHKRAVIEAGHLFEKVLEAAGGGSGDLEVKIRRVIIEPDFDFDQLKKAHLLWRDVVNNPERPLTKPQAQEAVDVYHQTLELLKYF
jgi:hypothetical protein